MACLILKARKFLLVILFKREDFAHLQIRVFVLALLKKTTLLTEAPNTP